MLVVCMLLSALFSVPVPVGLLVVLQLYGLCFGKCGSGVVYSHQRATMLHIFIFHICFVMCRIKLRWVCPPSPH
jgi:hypothetical protein